LLKGFLDVIIHQKTKTNINYRVIKAKKGELKSNENSNLIQLVLNDGHLYQAVEGTKGDKRKYPFAQSDFETYTMNIDLSEFNNVDLEEERDLRTEKMKNISRLTKDIDSIKQDNIRRITSFSKITSERMGAFVAMPKKDTTDQLMNTAKNSTTNVLTSIQGKKKEMNKRYEFHRRHILSLHKKFALAFSCIILFFVGAPLGAIIRKGGLGLPLSTLVMLPLGIFLTKRATADKGLMSFGRVIDFFKKILPKKKDKSIPS